MPGTPRKPSDAPAVPPPQDEERRPEPNDWREPGGDVKEPPPPGTAGTDEKFLREREI